MIHFDLRKKKLFELILVTVICMLCYSLCENAYFKGNGSRDFDNYGCKVWTANASLKNDSNMKTLEIHFEPLHQYKKCFVYYKVHLYRLRSDHSEFCDYRHGRLINVSVVSEDKHKKSVKFSNLRNGSYCFVIVPCSSECFRSWSLHFDVLIIQENRKNFARFKLSTTSVSEILAIGILIIAFVSGMLMCWRYKTRKRFEKTTLLDERCEDEEMSPLLEPKDIKVHILHPSDKDTLRKVALLKDFLKDCAKFNVVSMLDEIHLIYVDPRSWLSSILDCKCSRRESGCCSDKKVIIVQTEKVAGFVKYDISNLKKDKSSESLSSGESGELDGWYEYAFNCICVDWSRCFNDYCHLFVVCFDDSLCYSEQSGSITNYVRYSKPDDLIVLCTDLCSKFEDKSLKEELKNELENHPVKDVFL